MKKRYDDIKINPDTLLNELIWPATRYCIGRHTYVSNYAEIYFQLINSNSESFDEERVQFYARDVKDNIAQSMNWWKNISTSNTGNDRIEFDPYFLLCRYLYQHPDTDFASNHFDIDCVSGDIRVEPLEKTLTDSELCYNKVPDCDLVEWSKLACCLTQSFAVEVKGEKVEVIEFYDHSRYSADEPWRWEKELILTRNWRRIVNPQLLSENKNNQ